MATGVGFSVDYRDPWTIDVFTGQVTGKRSTRAAEKRIIDGAEFVFHVNDAIADAYRRLYPESSKKHRVVYNGYDPGSIPEPPGPSTPPYRFGILGTVNDRWPMKPILKGWASSRPDLPRGSELVLAGHLGYFDHSREAIEAALPDEDSGFRYVGPVRKAEVSDFYASIDVVVLPVPGGPMVTSGKVFEALALGKPVVCVQTAGGGARALLDRHPLSVGAEPDAESVRKALLRAADMARDLDPEEVATVRSSGMMYERQRAMQPMLDAISGHTGGSR
jgi:glycosyltransferase involved in cell wall biosynthesis